MRPFPTTPITPGAATEGGGTEGARPGGASSGGAGGVKVETFPVEDTSVSTRRPSPTSPFGFPSIPQFPRLSLQPAVAEPGGVHAGGTGDTGGVVAGGSSSRGAEAGDTGIATPTPRNSLSSSQWTRRSPLSRAAFPKPRRSRYGANGPFHLVLHSGVPPPPVLLQPPESSLNVFRDPLSDYLRASRPIVSRVLFALVTHLTAPPLSVSELVTTVSAFASSHHLDYATHLMNEAACEEAEMASHSSTSTYVDAVPPSRANVLSGMWLYEVKRRPGAPLVFHARYVARGFSQREGVDFVQTFALTSKMTTLQVLPHIAAQRDYELHSSDFSAAFLQGSRSAQFFVLVYVDDLVFAKPDRHALASVKEELLRRHTCTDLGELQCYLGLQITRDRAPCTITLTQLHMVKQILTRFRFPFSKVQLTLVAMDHGLTAPPSDKSFESSGPYPELVGCRMYLMTRTRPNLAYPLSILGRFVAPGRHRPSHWCVVERVAKYMASTLCMGLVLGGKQPVTLTGFLDLSWADDVESLRSTQGYRLSLKIGAVSWRSTRASSISSSSQFITFPIPASIAVTSLILCTDPSLPPFYVIVYDDNSVFATADTEALSLVKAELQKRHNYINLGHDALPLLDLLATAHSSAYEPLALSSTFERVRRAKSCEAKIYAGDMAAQELRWLTYLLTDLGE
ncbi:unnamed protein product [Closterium sp. NIES-53]